MKTKKELLAELFITCIELTDESFTAFCRYHAHVDQIEIDIHLDGWANNNCYDKQFLIYTTHLFDREYCQRVINGLIDMKEESTKERELLASSEELRKAARKKELLKELEELDK